TSPVEAMRLEEIARTHVFLRVALITCLAGAMIALMTRGDRTALAVVLVGCAVTTLGASWMLYLLRDVEKYTTRRLLGPALVVEFLYLVTFITARVSQRVTLDAMHKLETAVRGVAHREALLAEARAELDRALKVGGPGRFTDQVVGSFRLGVLIGRGGMGEVYEAHSMSDQREAAVKLLHPGTLGDPTHVQRFLREAAMASKLDSPNVVRVLEVGTT